MYSIHSYLAYATTGVHGHIDVYRDFSPTAKLLDFEPV